GLQGHSTGEIQRIRVIHRYLVADPIKVESTAEFALAGPGHAVNGSGIAVARQVCHGRPVPLIKTVGSYQIRTWHWRRRRRWSWVRCHRGGWSLTRGWCRCQCRGRSWYHARWEFDCTNIAPIATRWRSDQNIISDRTQTAALVLPGPANVLPTIDRWTIRER